MTSGGIELNQLPKISVVVPVFNVEKYLPKCLDSILSQTYKNLEIILVDDGSPDKSGSVCDDYALKDKRITVIHKENAGVCSARNTAMKKITGDYLTFVDSDDFLEKTAYEKVIKAMLRTKADVCFFGWKRISEADGKAEHTFKGKKGVGSASAAVRQSLIFNGYAGHIWNKVFSVSPWNKNGKICFPEMNTEYAVAEDCEWLMRTLPEYKKAVFLDEELYNYLVRSDSAINTDKFTAARLTEIKAREKISQEAVQIRKDYENIARAKAYSRLIQNGKLAFKIHDKKAASMIKPHLARNRKGYFKSPEISITQKIKAAVTEVLVRLV